MIEVWSVGGGEAASHTPVTSLPPSHGKGAEGMGTNESSIATPVTLSTFDIIALSSYYGVA